MNLTNNHDLNFDMKGLFDTLKTLDAAGIKHTGTDTDSEDASRPIVFSKNDISIGLLGFTDNEPGWKAGARKPGVNYLDIFHNEDKDHNLLSIQALHKQVDIAVISFHWEPNMKVYPDKLFVDFAHAIVEHGASFIHGHNVHNFQKY